MKEGAEAYLERDAEHLVLEGYRRWCKSIISGDFRHLDELQQVYRTVLEEREAFLAYSAMLNFTKALASCAKCSLKTNGLHCPWMCFHECMILGLVSGIQHNEQTSICLCLDMLVESEKHDVAFNAAETFACILNVFGKTLLPVPAATIRRILEENGLSTTLH